MKFELLPGSEVADFWRRLMQGLPDPAEAYGPEWATARPRPADTYYLVSDGASAIGLMYTQSPAMTTRVFALGLFKEFRGQGMGLAFKNAAIDFCFESPSVNKVETEIYASNTHSMAALRRPGSNRMALEGEQRDTIQVGGVFFARFLFGLTRKTFEKVKGVAA